MFIALLFLKLFLIILFQSPGVLAEHTIVGLETGRRCHLPGRTEAGLHCPELLGARILDHDGQSVRHEIVQDGKWGCSPRDQATHLRYTRHTHTTGAQ